MGIPVGDLFRAAVAPGVVLVGLYILYILYTSWRNPQAAPSLSTETTDRRKLYTSAILHVLPPLALILIVLGSIFAGIATPTESSALGSVGALLLAVIYRHFSWKLLYEAALDSVRVTAMVFAILLGATAFSMAFSYTGGDILVEDALLDLPGDEIGFLALSMLTILLLGFFIDFVEISFIIVPILAPAAEALGIAPPVVCHPHRHEPAKLLPDTTLRIQPLLSQGSRTARGHNHGYLPWRGAFHTDTGSCARFNPGFSRLVWTRLKSP